MKRYKVNHKASNKRFKKQAGRTHRMNTKPAGAMSARGGIRL